MNKSDSSDEEMENLSDDGKINIELLYYIKFLMLIWNLSQCEEFSRSRRKRRKIISDEEKSPEDADDDTGAEDNERDEDEQKDDSDMDLADVPAQSEYYR